MSKLSKKQRDELAHLSAKKDSELDLTDIPEITDFSKGERGRFYRPIKKSVTIRLDADILSWFKQEHPKYQTAINEVLRKHMEDR